MVSRPAVAFPWDWIKAIGISLFRFTLMWQVPCLLNSTNCSSSSLAPQLLGHSQHLFVRLQRSEFMRGQGSGRDGALSQN